jgi:hypothetical protein
MAIKVVEFQEFCLARRQIRQPDVRFENLWIRG